MLLVADVKGDRRLPVPAEAEQLWGIEKLNVPRSTVPAITHVDYSARIQTVRRETNPLYYDIMAAFNRRTGCPIIVNTSFNVRGEPIVCSPVDGSARPTTLASPQSTTSVSPCRPRMMLAGLRSR